MADREVTDTTQAGIWITVNREGGHDHVSVPGDYAAVVVSNGYYFTVDMAGNVRGDPAAVEREALSLGVHENLIAKAAVGLARLAMRSKCRDGND